MTLGKLPPLSEPALIYLQNVNYNPSGHNGTSRLLGFINERRPVGSS